MAQGRKYPDSYCLILRREYEAGATLQQLVDTYGSDRSTISRLIVRVGGKMRSRARAQQRNTTIPRSEWPAILEKYNNGATLREIGELYNTSFHNIRAYILRSGGTMRKGGGPRPKKRKGLLGWLDS